jgi:DoxX-like family
MGQPQSRVRSVTAWILTGLLALLLIASAAAKLLGAEPAVKGFTDFGLGDYILLIGVGELVSAILFLIPRTNSLGLLLLSAYMGGAIVTHMQHGESFVAQSVILLLVWVAGYLRHPEVLQSFREGVR